MFQPTHSHIQQAKRIASNPAQFAGRTDLRFCAWAALKRQRGQDFHWQRLRALAGLEPVTASTPPLQQVLDTARLDIRARVLRRAAEISSIATGGPEGAA